mmetsp:Transcript_5656/g.6137  ORF Transcript_5656/g.6137 Transcript_5656/m.6137 type:complete len:353 (-) Transcript_5656:19-1077(-)
MANVAYTPVNVLQSSPLSKHGYTPTYSSPTNYSNKLYMSPQLSREKKQVWAILKHDTAVQRMLMLFAVFGVSSLVTIFSAYRIGCVALLACGFHALFHCCATGINLIGRVWSKYRPSRTSTYGYDRYEIIWGFTNGTFLTFAGLYSFFEALERIFFEPSEVDANGLLWVPITSLIVHIIGAMYFTQYLTVRSESVISAKTKIADRLVDVTNIALPSLLATVTIGLLNIHSQWHHADAYFALAIVGLIFFTAVPVCMSTGRVLLLGTPSTLQAILDKNLQDVVMIPGVQEVKRESTHFWTYSPGVFVGTLVVRTEMDADDQQICQQITRIFRPITSHLTIQVEKDDWMQGRVQ